MIKSRVVLFATLLIGAITFVSCGKITQEVAPKKAKKRLSFELKTTVNIPSSNITNNGMVYTAIYGVNEFDTLAQLSWGKAKLRSTKTTVSENTTVTWQSIAYNARNVKITKSNLTETFISLRHPSQNTYELAIRAKKLKRHYPVYIGMVYSNKNDITFFNVSERLVSKNTIVTIPSPTEYDSFITSIYLKHLEHKDYALAQAIPISHLKSLYTQAFFDSLSFTKPTNTIRRFDVKKPLLISDRALELFLIKVIDFLHDKDKNSTFSMIKKTKKPTLSKKSLNHLFKAIKSYTKPTLPTLGQMDQSSTQNATTTPNVF